MTVLASLLLPHPLPEGLKTVLPFRSGIGTEGQLWVVNRLLDDY